MTASARRIGDLVPQSGAMVLLDEVLSHDATRIVCSAQSHRDPRHPLRHEGTLSIWAGIEYAAQAMAAHFSLDAGIAGAATIGLLGGLRDVVASADRLDDVAAPLVVAVERLSRDAAGSIYAFTLTAGPRELLRGRATVVQQRRSGE